MIRKILRKTLWLCAGMQYRFSLNFETNRPTIVFSTTPSYGHPSFQKEGTTLSEAFLLFAEIHFVVVEVEDGGHGEEL